MVWIELKHRSPFSRQLVCTSNYFEGSSYAFAYAYRFMVISKNGETIATTDGATFLKIGRIEFLRKGMFFRELSSETNSLKIEWGPLPGEKFSYSSRCNIGDGDTLYKIKNFSIYTPIYMTRTKIETEHDISDVIPAIGYLAFFWMWYEEERRVSLES